MSVGLSDELLAFEEAIRDFAARECGTAEQRRELGDGSSEGHNEALYRRLGELGWIGCCLPERYGGAGGGALEACVFLEQAALGRLPIGAASVSLIVAKAIEKFGTEEQKAEILGAACAGEPLAIAMSEPNAGSDVGALACRAVRDGDAYVVNGQKTWISHAQRATRILLVCRSDRSGSKHEGITMLLLDPKAPGVEVRPIDTLGGREVNDIFLEDVRIDAADLVGVEGAAWTQLMAGLNFERLVVAATMLGTGRRAFEDALAFVKEREQFGRPVGSFQALRHRIADLATELECTRLLVYSVARRTDANPGVQMPREASMAKLKATETAKRAAIEGMQMMGGYGYATEYDMEGHLRKAIVSTVYGGTSEIQRDIIGRSYGL
ncbi:MAG: acyl-CoA/acyl-ACP dehydrogenase [Actinobacteria bacterium]|nr:acyl-CoA/acyl-ACP dehydrogenase [Actinomycetota bacterium]